MQVTSGDFLIYLYNIKKGDVYDMQHRQGLLGVGQDPTPFSPYIKPAAATDTLNQEDTICSLRRLHGAQS